MKNEKQDKVKHPIGAKLIIIITVLLLLSLGAVTALMSFLMSKDVQITAEDNNFAVNRRSASEAERFLSGISANTLVLLDTINLIGANNSAAAVNIFFERNREIAFIGIVQNTGGIHNIIRSYTNERFFASNQLENNLPEIFIENNKYLFEQLSAQEPLLANAAPVFNMPILALSFPWHEGSRNASAIVLFSSNSLTESFSDGANISYMVNNKGEILIHADFELIRTNTSSFSLLVSESLNNADRSMQTLYTENDGKKYIGAYRKISIGNAAVITAIPCDVVFEGVTATTRRNLFLTGAVMFISVIYVWFFSKTVSVPLKALASAALQIESGNFNFEIKPKTQDEVGLLTKSFNRMTNALNIFGRFTNKEVAIKAMRGEIKPGGLPKHATIFFSDIRGFTEKSENFTKEFGDDACDKIIYWLNRYFTEMVDCVEKTQGVVDKFIGDAVMAHWGTAYSAGSPAKDAFNCVKAALMMRNALYKLNQTRTPNDKENPPIQIGCGINTGIVTAGQLGSDQRMEYTVIGDPVNLASRIEALNKPLGTDILISEDTWNLIGQQFTTEEMPSVTVKGKTQPVRLFAVVNLKGAKGPQILADVRKLLGITPPDISKVDTSADEKKYKIGNGV